MSSSGIIIVILTSITLTLFAFFFIGFLIFHNRKMVQNRDEIQTLELAKAKKSLIEAIEIQEAERSRIGSDIHDDLGPTLSAIKLKINHLTSNEATTSRNIIQLKSMVDDTIKVVRGLSHSLYPTTLEKYGLSNAISELSQRINSPSIKTSFEIDDQIDKLSFYKQINIYRIIQEFCNNSIKYSNCSNIIMTMNIDEDCCSLTLSDNGIGFNIEVDEMGLGIKNMRMRSEAIDFDFRISSTLGKGTVINLQKRL